MTATPPPVSVSLVCHCGETFTLDEIDQAQAHVAAHGEQELEGNVDVALSW